MNHELEIKKQRAFLRGDVWNDVDFSLSDQSQGVPMPPIQKPVPEGESPVSLPEWRGTVRPRGGLEELIGSRRSLRRYTETPLSAEEISFLLWATQGVREQKPGRVFRTVPAGGNRHSTETYLVLTRPAKSRDDAVTLSPGIWRYLPLSHSVLYMGCPEDLGEKVTQAAEEQRFVGQAPAIFFWACIPYRSEWRYQEASHKVIALDTGHICQNLYLASESIGCGTCAIAAYDQKKADALLGIDGEDEFVIYLAPVGKNPFVKTE